MKKVCLTFLLATFSIANIWGGPWGFLVSNKDATTVVPLGKQKTYVFFQKNVQTLVIQPRVLSKVSQYAIVVPVPSAPSVRQLPKDLFSHIAQAIDPPYVKKGKAYEIDYTPKKTFFLSTQYQTNVFKSKKELQKWLKQFKLHGPKATIDRCFSYLSKGWEIATFYVNHESLGMLHGSLPPLAIRFHTRRFVMPSKLINADMRHIFYILAPKGVKMIPGPTRYIKRQIFGAKLYKGLTAPLQIEGIKLNKKVKQELEEIRSPQKYNGLAKELFSSDLLSVAYERLSHPYEELQKVKTFSGIESFTKASQKELDKSLQKLKRMNLTVVDGEFSATILSQRKLYFRKYQMSSSRNSSKFYDARLYGPEELKYLLEIEENKYKQRQILNKLRYMGPEAEIAASYIVKLLNNKYLRFATEQTLSRMKNKALPVLLEQIKGSSEDAKKSALRILSRGKYSEVVAPVLIEVLIKESDPKLQHYARVALAKMAGKKPPKVYRNKKSLSLVGPKIGDIELKYIGGLEITTLKLAHTQISDEGLFYLQGLSKLTSLDLCGTSIGDAGLESLQTFSQLETLNLSGTKVSDKGLVFLKNFSKLKFLNLNETKIGDMGIKHLPPGIRHLELKNTKITDKGLESLNKRISHLNIAYTLVGGKGLRHLKNLMHLNLGHTRINDKRLRYIAHLSRLVTLNLQGTLVKGQGLKKLTNLEELLFLNLSYLKIKAKHLKHLTKLNRLEDLSLMGTKLDDKAARNIKKLTGLANLNLLGTKISYNELENIKTILVDCTIKK